MTDPGLERIRSVLSLIQMPPRYLPLQTTHLGIYVRWMGHPRKPMEGRTPVPHVVITRDYANKTYIMNYEDGLRDALPVVDPIAHLKRVLNNVRGFILDVSLVHHQSRRRYVFNQSSIFQFRPLVRANGINVKTVRAARMVRNALMNPHTVIGKKRLRREFNRG